tara:strand:+ start:276 stop:404 length:129 start_codon:yes stop_codon:yes gene_type:complete
MNSVENVVLWAEEEKEAIQQLFKKEVFKIRTLVDLFQIQNYR